MKLEGEIGWARIISIAAQMVLSVMLQQKVSQKAFEKVLKKVEKKSNREYWCEWSTVSTH